MKLADIGKNTIQEEIYEVTKKIHLLEGGRKAVVETSSVKEQKNQNQILEFRDENKRLHKQLAQMYLTDNRVVQRALADRPIEKAAYRRMPGSSVCTDVDLKVLECKRKLNWFKAITVGLKQKLKILQQSLYYMHIGESKNPEKLNFVSAQLERSLENQLDKAVLKWHEAKRINLLYEKIKYHLLQESLNFENQLDDQDRKLFAMRRELSDIQSIYANAQLVRDYEKKGLHDEEGSFNA